MTLHFGVKTRLKVQVSPWTRIDHTLAHGLILFMWDQKLARTARTRSEGLVAFAIQRPVNVTFSTQTLTRAGHLAVLVHLTLPAGTLGVKLKTLSSVKIVVQNGGIAEALGGIAGVIVSE